MALTNTTQFANRYGLNIKIYEYTDGTVPTGDSATPKCTVDFANVTDIEVNGDITWATGGQGHVNKIGFNDPMTGTFKLSTQIMTVELLKTFACDTTTTAGTVVFKNAANSTPKYYTISAETVWQDAAGATYSETMTFHKVCPKRALNLSYSGEGDPMSVDFEFDLLEDANGNMLTIKKAEATA